MNTLRAVIDVGTNSVKLLVAAVQGAQVRPLLEESEQTRLGAGFYETHRLQPQAIARTVEAITLFAGKARAHGVSQIRLIATSAARDAHNAADLRDAALKASGLEMEIISGDLEAELAFQGVTSTAQFAEGPTLILDVGGGSTEFILGDHGHARWAQSYPLGTVRLLERFPPADPPGPAELTTIGEWTGNYLRKEVLPSLKRVGWVSEAKLVGTGGTSTLLAKMELGLEGYDREPIENLRLSRSKIEVRTRALWALTHAERERIRGLPAKRADVILMGAVIYAAVMEVLEFEELRISTRGLRFAAVLELETAQKL